MYLPYAALTTGGGSPSNNGTRSRHSTCTLHVSEWAWYQVRWSSLVCSWRSREDIWYIVDLNVLGRTRVPTPLVGKWISMGHFLTALRSTQVPQHRSWFMRKSWQMLGAVSVRQSLVLRRHTKRVFQQLRVFAHVCVVFLFYFPIVFPTRVVYILMQNWTIVQHKFNAFHQRKTFGGCQFCAGGVEPVFGTVYVNDSFSSSNSDAAATASGGEPW